MIVSRIAVRNRRRSFSLSPNAESSALLIINEGRCSVTGGEIEVFLRRIGLRHANYMDQMELLVSASLSRLSMEPQHHAM